jgi:predicted nucleotidyltransferase
MGMGGKVKLADDVKDIAREIRSWLVKRYKSKIKGVILYGSHARGTAKEDSDVDFLIVVDESLDPWEVFDYLDEYLFELLLKTGKPISAIVVTESYFDKDSPFISNVRREGIPIK